MQQGAHCHHLHQSTQTNGALFRLVVKLSNETHSIDLADTVWIVASHSYDSTSQKQQKQMQQQQL
jgi:hypothetical protein